MREQITVDTIVNAPAEKAWEFFTRPDHIVRWNNASPDWYTPTATNDLRVGGEFDYRMEAKDGSAGFNLKGTYTEVMPSEKISYTLEDGRNVEVFFTQQVTGTRIIETFEAENQNPLEMQRSGWQAILDNLKADIEAN